MRKLERAGKINLGRKIERNVPTSRMYPARLHRIEITAGSRFIVEVRLSRTRKQMLDQTRRFGRGLSPDTQGCVRYVWSNATRGKRPIVIEGRIVARMFLNDDDLKNAPADILAHEATHAGMAWARYKRANLKVMEGEEVLAYSVGHVTQRLANTFWGRVS